MWSELNNLFFFQWLPIWTVLKLYFNLFTSTLISQVTLFCVGERCLKSEPKWRRWLIGVESSNHVGSFGQSRLSVYRCLPCESLWGRLFSLKNLQQHNPVELLYCTRCNKLEKGFLSLYRSTSYSALAKVRLEWACILFGSSCRLRYGKLAFCNAWYQRLNSWYSI